MEVSFISYSALSTPPYFLPYVLWQLLKGSLKHSSFWKDSQRLFKIIFQPLFIFTPSHATHVNTNLHKYKNGFDSSKDRLDTKILSQFSKLQVKKPFVRSFLFSSLKLYRQVLLVSVFTVCANGYC